MDLRGTTATIVNPKTVLDLDDSASGDRVVVLDTEDEGNTGWLIDEVSRVVSVDETGLDESVEGESVRGVVRRDDDFVIWIEPSAVHA
jgi:purine-binding chemotaxis protein CheW